MALSVICPSCGHRQLLSDDYPRRKARCPECGVMCPVPEPAERQPAQPEDEEVASRLLDEVEPPVPAAPKKKERPLAAPPVLAGPQLVSTQDDDGNPYGMEGPAERQCPQCHRGVPEDALLCVACGLDFRKGKKVARTYEPMVRSWDLGIPEPRRWPMFLGLSALGLALSVFLALRADEWSGFAGSWLTFTALLSFLLGTYFHAELTRDRRGRVVLTRAWRICFVRRPAREIDLRPFAGVRINLSREAGFLEWLIFFNLFLYGIIPGVLWWYHVIQTDRYHVALTRDQGYAEEILYRGNDAALAEEVAATLRDAGRLRLEKD